MRTAIRDGRPVAVELVNYAKDDRRYVVRVEIQPLVDDAGQLDGFKPIESDVTERHENRAELARRSLELERRRRQAESASEAKSAFLANMSHEIRTPMTAIMGYTSILRHEDGLTAERRAECVETIERNGEHLLEIINDILDLSKIEAGKMSVERVSVDLRRLLADLVRLMRVKSDGKGIALELGDLSALPPAILADPVRLRQILMNLVGNAIKFTEIGGVSIRAEHGPDDAGVPRLRVVVEDTGIAMREDQVAHIFAAFAQADASTTRRFGGTGLGLHVSRSLARMMGGDIGASSELGQGSVFTLEVEAPSAELAPESASERRADAIAASGTGALAGVRIHFAEDGPDNQRLIAFHLRKAGAQVRVFDNGRRCLEALTADGTAEGPLAEVPPCDLVLTDMQMPEMDGYSLARTLRAKGWTRPIVAVTAHAMSGDEERCRAAGCDGYATKPIDRDRLIALCAAHAAEAATDPAT